MLNQTTFKITEHKKDFRAMAIRHFKRDANGNESGSDSPESSDGEEHEIDDPQEVVVERDEEQENDKSENEESSDVDNSESSSSEDEGVVQFQRPLFLRSGKRKHASDDDSQERESRKRGTVMEKIQHENRAIKAREELELQMKSEYRTDDMLGRAMLLDDNDYVDPEHEKQEWLKRQELRRKRHRDAMVARQLEVEEYEANKLKFSDAQDIKVEGVATRESRAEKDDSKANPSRKWKPSRAQDTQFAALNGSPGNSKEDSEYSCI